jgi:hypothetical protein
MARLPGGLPKASRWAASSLLEARVIKRGGEVQTMRIGGRSVLVCDGWIEVGDTPG